MSDLQNAIIKLMSSPHYKKLAAYEPPFNPFEIVGATHRELIHSSVLAWLLRDEANKEFCQRFVDKIATDKPKLGLSVSDDSGNSRLKPKEVETEYSFEASKAGADFADFDAGRFDVFAHFESLDFVIGIEVKVNAGEGPEQVEKYQNFLCKEYSSYKKVIVFLTREGQKPGTADENKGDVPVLAMSWGCVSKIIREMRPALGNENNFRMQFLQHLERNIVMNEREEQRIVRELLSEGDNTETLDKIIMNDDDDGDEQRIVRELLSEGDNVETLNKIIMNETKEQRKVREQSSEGGNAETLNKILNNMSSLRTSLECEFWIELRKQLRDQLRLQDEELQFQLYQDGLKIGVIEDGRLEEHIKRRDGRSSPSPGLTFRIRGSSLSDDDHEVACRITYDPSLNSYYLYYGFVLCKKNNIRERVKIKNNDGYHRKYLDLLGRKILKHGPDEEGKHGWLGWNERTIVNITFADKPDFNTLVPNINTLVEIKKNKENVAKNLIHEIFGVIKTIYPEQ